MTILDILGSEGDGTAWGHQLDGMVPDDVFLHGAGVHHLCADPEIRQRPPAHQPAHPYPLPLRLLSVHAHDGVGIVSLPK